MMDKQLVFCEGQSVTATFQSGKIDFGHAYPTTGLNDRPLFVVIQSVGTAVAGSGTLTVAIESSADGSSSWTPELSSGALTAAQINAGVALPMPIKHKRYLRLNCTVGGSLTAGTVSAFLSDAINVPMNIPKVGIEYLPTLPSAEEEVLTKAQADALYLGKTAKAASASTADACTGEAATAAALKAGVKISLTSQVTGTLPVANGGTGATTAEGARTNLGAAAAGG